jgi:hypothetical protein
VEDQQGGRGGGEEAGCLTAGEAGAEAIEYVSARDVDGGLNVALFTPLAFAARQRRAYSPRVGLVPGLI